MNKLQLTTRSSNAHIKDDVQLKMSELMLALGLYEELPKSSKRSWQSVFEPMTAHFAKVTGVLNKMTPHTTKGDADREFSASFSSEIFEKFYDDLASNSASFDEYAVREDDDDDDDHNPFFWLRSRQYNDCWDSAPTTLPYSRELWSLATTCLRSTDYA